MKKNTLLRAALVAALTHTATATLIDFETPSLGSATHKADWRPATGFNSGGAFFNNSYTDFGGGFFSWSGFALSRETDVTTPGFGNQFSAFTGIGFGGSSQYAVAYVDSFGLTPQVTFAPGESPLSLRITNTTYAALSMRDGDAFAKKFGGTSGNDPDFFKLTITGLDTSNATTGTVEFYLADYRFTDNSQDYILNQWALVDVSTLPTTTAALRFTLSSSDNGAFGMNTPAYFAVDQITTVPEPAATLLAAAGAICFAVRRRR